MAERVGFEPTCGVNHKLISSQPRYDRFDTAPLEFCGIISAIRKKIKDFRKKSIPVLKKQRLPPVLKKQRSPNQV